MPKAQGTVDPLGGCVGGSRPSQRAYTSLHENLVSNYSTMLQATLRPCNEVSNEVSIKVSNNPDGRGAMARESYSVGSVARTLGTLWTCTQRVDARAEGGSERPPLSSSNRSS